MLNGRYVKINQELELKIITFPGYLNKVIYFLPGWIADLKNLMPFIVKLQEAGFTVKYVETREKKSSIFTHTLSNDDFMMEKYAKDLEKIIEHEEDSQFQFLSASLIRCTNSHL